MLRTLSTLTFLLAIVVGIDAVRSATAQDDPTVVPTPVVKADTSPADEEPVVEEEFDIEVLYASNNEKLADIDRPTSIERLLLTGDGITNTGLKNLAGIGRIGTLSIQETRITNGGLMLLEQLPSLRSLRLWKPGFNDMALERIKKLATLESLDIDGTGITGTGLVHLASLPNLKALTLGSEIEDDQLAAITKLKSLEELDLRTCRLVTDAGLAHIAGLTKLRVLWLPPAATDECVESLTKLTNLKTLGLSKQIGMASKILLETTLPECKVRN